MIPQKPGGRETGLGGPAFTLTVVEPLANASHAFLSAFVLLLTTDLHSADFNDTFEDMFVDKLI